MGGRGGLGMSGTGGGGVLLVTGRRMIFGIAGAAGIMPGRLAGGVYSRWGGLSPAGMALGIIRAEGEDSSWSSSILLVFMLGA